MPTAFDTRAFERQAFPLKAFDTNAFLTPEGGDEVVLAPLYSRAVFWGDGIVSIAAAPGIRNIPYHFFNIMKGRVVPAIGYNQGHNGGNLDSIYGNWTYAFEQVPEIFIFATQGHNDGIFTSDYVAQMVKWERNLDAAVAALPSTTKIVVSTTIQSAVAGESTYWTTVNNLQKAKVSTLQGVHGSRIILWDLFATWDYLTMTPVTDTGRVHPDERGGYHGGNSLATLLDSYVVSETKNNILNDTASKSWRSANLYADTALSGTGGTKAGTITPTGNYATGQRITNNLTDGSGVGVVCSKDAQSGYDNQVVAMAGTPASTQNVVLDDTASGSFGAGSVPGAHFLWRSGLTVDNGSGGTPAQLFSYGAIMSSFGSMGTTTSPGGITAPIAQIVDIVQHCTGTIFGTSGPASQNPQTVCRFAAGDMTGSRIIYSRPSLFQIELNPYAQPKYLGNDGKFATNFMLRVTGTGVSGTTVTAATVTTIRLEPGVWSGGASDWSTCFTRAMRRNGTPVAGAFASGWTYDATGAWTGGDTIAIDVVMNNGIGSAVTQTLTLTVV